MIFYLTNNMKKIATLCLAVLFLSGCTKPQSTATEANIANSNAMNQWPDGVCYEIFIQSFADSNGDGIGDLPGATSKLDYLQDLGIRAVWLMPIMASPSYHKYDVTDYKLIHPDYGTMDDFKTFIAEAHKRDIKVVIDMIINHSSSEHPWFKEASKGPDNPYRD
jgi:glycosidase